MKVVKIFYILSVLIFVCGCDLDRFPLDSLAPEKYYNNREELSIATNKFYSLFPTAEHLYGETSDIIIPTVLIDEVQGIRTVPTSGGGWSWTSLSDINTYLMYSKRCADEMARNEYNALAHFFRAFFYFEKIKRFGEVPWFDAPLSSTDAKLYELRTGRDELMDHIRSDMDDAISFLPKEPNLYKVTKWSALALKSRIFLYEGTYRKYHHIAGSDKFLQLAVDAAQEFVQNAPYSIYAKGEKAYLSLFTSNKAIKDEVILARNYNIDINTIHNINQYFLSAGSKPGMNKKIVDSYLMNDGSRFTDKVDYKLMSFYDEMQGRDPRLSQTIVTPGYTRLNSEKLLSPNFNSTTTGYQIIKGVTSENADGWHKSHNDFPLFRAAEVYLNLAEAKAELGTLTQADLDRTISKLRARVGMPPLTMATANANPDPYLMSAETGYPQVDGPNKGVILEIRRERTIELFGEGFRYDDLMRWKEGKAFEKQFRGMYVPALDPKKKFVVLDLNGNGKSDALDVCVYDGEQVPTENMYPELSGISTFLKLGDNIELEHGAKGGNIIVHDIRKKPRKWNEGRDYLYPIPQDQVTLYGGKLTQNPNW